jgi:hypothetical protein
MTASDLYRWVGARRGGRLGRLQRVCIFATGSAGNCAGTLYLPAGTVRVQGYVDFDHGPDVVAVVGGTGAYLGARGTFTSQPLGRRDSTRSSGTIRILR